MADRIKSCSIVGCNGNADSYAKGSKGLCSKHYKRWKRFGSPLLGGPFRDDTFRARPGEPLQWLRDHSKYNETDCLIWPFAKSLDGYAQIHIDGKLHLAGRAMCRIAHGEPLNPTDEAAHSCGKGNMGCVSPAHLRWLTHSDNEADKVAHGTVTRGERHPRTSLTEIEVFLIRQARGRETTKAIASRFGISGSSVRDIHSGRTWAWLT